MIESKIEGISLDDLQKSINNEMKFQDRYLEFNKNIKYIDINNQQMSFDESTIENKNIYHVNDFMNYFDEDFIKNIYRGLLKREFDQKGFDYYLDKLRSTKLHRIEILARLYFSKECKSNNIKIKGLYLRLLTRLIYKIPILGYFIRLVLSIFRLPKIVKNQEDFEIQVMTKLNNIKNNINQNYNHDNSFNKNEINKINDNFNQIIKLLIKRDFNEI